MKLAITYFLSGLVITVGFRSSCQLIRIRFQSITVFQLSRCSKVNQDSRFAFDHAGIKTLLGRYVETTNSGHDSTFRLLSEVFF